jgi:biotin-dependent carboxylase-like uncharacterized protein
MTGALKIIQPGLSTTVQDLGRTGRQRFGIPVSGAADWVALRAANVVVGNAQETAGLEMVLMGPVVEVMAEAVRVAVAGGTAELAVTRAESGESVRVPALQSVRARRGDRIRIGAITGSTVAYLVIEGGIGVAPFQNSRSTYVRGGIGGFEGRPLKEGDLLSLSRDSVPERGEMRLEGLQLAPKPVVRIVAGPQDDYFTPEALARLTRETYTVSREADRMGMRLDGPVLTHAKGFNIVSDGIAPGAIQVPGNGLPIILLADRQSTGGYPKIATVASADLPALGRTGPGAKLRFELISVEAAQRLRRELEAEIAQLGGRLAPAGATGPDLARLLNENLISGVADAHD